MLNYVYNRIVHRHSPRDPVTMTEAPPPYNATETIAMSDLRRNSQGSVSKSSSTEAVQTEVNFRRTGSLGPTVRTSVRTSKPLIQSRKMRGEPEPALVAMAQAQPERNLLKALLFQLVQAVLLPLIFFLENLHTALSAVVGVLNVFGDSGCPPIISIHVAGQPTQALADTGSGVTLISETLAYKLKNIYWERPTIRPPCP